ncbi:MAG: nucleotide sugar dehydrogenase [Oligoflexia bacterium]|nr:nucleotide sugar dehydrogenase [Oligoflexia bacterium]
MKITVLGLGYVGTITSICLHSLDHEITGIEVNEEKLKAFQEKQIPIYEPGLAELFDKAHGSSRMKFKSQLEPGEIDADVYIVCVGTPSLSSGGANLSQLKSTVMSIGRILRDSQNHPLVIIRSTSPPGTTEELVIPMLETESKRKSGKDFHVCFYPEFLREGQAISDFFNPSLNVVGFSEQENAAAILEKINLIFRVAKPAHRSSIRAAEMIKYINNCFHAAKVAFANEMGVICKAYSVNSNELFDLFLSDTTLNISPVYLRPGFAFGGSCLPKELHTASSLASHKGLKTPLLDSVLVSNDEHIDRLLYMIEKANVKNVSFVGATFKANTDDIRFSPIVEAIDRLMEMPSYQKPGLISVVDRPQAQEKLKERYGDKIVLANNLSEALNSSEMILLGPYNLPKDDVDQLANFKGTIIDLKWHKWPYSITKHPRYEAIC